ncbi:MAG: hypothetical protein HY401_04720 [Elusimicrobia bacterium]|nr:hypothetical protein [Elusimicrobiota bacterium]
MKFLSLLMRSALIGAMLSSSVSAENPVLYQKPNQDMIKNWKQLSDSVDGLAKRIKMNANYRLGVSFGQSAVESGAAVSDNQKRRYAVNRFVFGAGAGILANNVVIVPAIQRFAPSKGRAEWLGLLHIPAFVGAVVGGGFGAGIYGNLREQGHGAASSFFAAALPSAMTAGLGSGLLHVALYKTSKAFGHGLVWGLGFGVTGAVVGIGIFESLRRAPVSR